MYLLYLLYLRFLLPSLPSHRRTLEQDAERALSTRRCSTVYWYQERGWLGRPSSKMEGTSKRTWPLAGTSQSLRGERRKG